MSFSTYTRTTNTDHLMTIAKGSSYFKIIQRIYTVKKMVLHIIYFIVINKMFKNKSSFHGSNVVSVKLVLAF